MGVTGVVKLMCETRNGAVRHAPAQERAPFFTLSADDPMTSAANTARLPNKHISFCCSAGAITMTYCKGKYLRVSSRELRPRSSSGNQPVCTAACGVSAPRCSSASAAGTTNAGSLAAWQNAVCAKGWAAEPSANGSSSASPNVRASGKKREASAMHLECITHRHLAEPEQIGTVPI